MKKITNILTWALLLFLITPSSMALASWNAVPGDTTYPWKLSLEKVLLMFMSPSSKLQSTTQVKITERRFSELEQTLNSEYAFESLDNLEKQLETTTSNIQKINKQETQAQVREQYVASLKKMSTSLNEQKSKIAESGNPAMVQKNTNSSSNTSNTTANDISDTVKPTTPPNNPTPEAPPSNEELIDEIEETEKKIEDIIIGIQEAAAIESEATVVNEAESEPVNTNIMQNDDEEKKESGRQNAPPSQQKENDRKTPSNNNSSNRNNSAEDWRDKNDDRD